MNATVTLEVLLARRIFITEVFKGLTPMPEMSGFGIRSGYAVQFASPML